MLSFRPFGRSNKVGISYGRQQARGYSAPVSVDQVLKQFYKMVHPDMFQDEKRDVNQKSFGHLMSYLDFIKTHSSANSTDAPSHFRLSFYTTKSQDKRIDLDVYPPADGAPAKEKKYHLHKTLTTLFSQCNFDHQPFYVDDFGKNAVVERYAKKGDLTLLKYILSTNGRFKETTKPDVKKYEATLEQHFLKIVGELVETFKISKLEFAVKSHLFLTKVDRFKKRIELIEDFRQCLNNMKNRDNFPLTNIAGVVIVFGSQTRIDENGNIELHHLDQEHWIRQISEYTRSHAEKLKEASKARIELQKKLAQKFDIASVTVDPEIAQTSEYRVFLQNVLRDVERKEYEPFIGLKRLTVKFAKINYLTSEEAGAILIVPMKTHTDDVREIINQNAYDLIKRNSVMQTDLNLVKKYLNLDSISWSQQDVQSSQLRETIDRLHKHSVSLKPYTSGLKLHIAGDYGINEESRTISIRWDYLVDVPKI